LAETLDSTLSARLRAHAGRKHLTESELRGLTDQADGLARSLRAQIRESERRLRGLAADETTGVAELAGELRRVETLRPQLEETEQLIEELQETARAVRTAWLLHQADAARRVE
jgi:hypothetical protein